MQAKYFIIEIMFFPNSVHLLNKNEHPQFRKLIIKSCYLIFTFHFISAVEAAAFYSIINLIPARGITLRDQIGHVF